MEKFFALSLFLFVIYTNSVAGVISTPNSEVKDFVFIPMDGQMRSGTDVAELNRWLKDNPNKKVVCFLGLPAYGDGLSGFTLHYESGDNSKQIFTCVNISDKILRESEITAHRMYYLQSWKESFPDHKIASIVAIPAKSGGIRKFIILHEKQ